MTAHATRRKILQTGATASLSVLASRAAQDAGRPRRVLAILGDAYHAAAPLDRALVGGLRGAGWKAVTIIDYAVPWEEFSRFDLIILSREAHEYVRFFRERDSAPAGKRELWITPAQERKFEEYVTAGGRLFLFHDGFGFYPKGGAVSRLAKAFFIRHPPIVEIEVSPTGKMPELNRGISPFKVADEEYEVEMDESQTSVYLESRSPQHGRHAQGWAHPSGKGKVAVLIPGHGTQTISHPMVRRSIQNILEWLTA